MVDEVQLCQLSLNPGRMLVVLLIVDEKFVFCELGNFVS